MVYIAHHDGVIWGDGITKSQAKKDGEGWASAYYSYRSVPSLDVTQCTGRLCAALVKHGGHKGAFKWSIDEHGIADVEDVET